MIVHRKVGKGLVAKELDPSDVIQAYEVELTCLQVTRRRQFADCRAEIFERIPVYWGVWEGETCE